MPGRILIVDDDPLVPRTLRLLLNKQGHDVRVAPGAAEAFRLLEAQPSDVVISDINMPGADGFDVLKHVKTTWPAAQVILVTGYGTIDSAVRGMREGAFDYVTKPVLDEEMLLVVERALESVRLRAENAELRAALDRTKGSKRVIGNDPSLLKVFDTIEAVAPTRATVLITGESGTGKSMIAGWSTTPRRGAAGPSSRSTAARSPRACSRASSSGTRRAPSPGATGTRTGRFLAADHGTLFLDEIGAATPALQLKLLRVLQERKFEPVGSEDSIEVDVRLILATNEDLAKCVAENRFRQDLFYRISVVPIHLPPLRERLADVPLLAQHFLKRFAEENEKPVQEIDDGTMTILQAHAWPGNIRELENVVERGVILARGDILMPGDLPPELTKSAPAPSGDRTLPLKRALEIPEREIIERTLREPGLEPPEDRPRPRHQPHDALQQDAEVRPPRSPTRLCLRYVGRRIEGEAPAGADPAERPCTRGRRRHPDRSDAGGDARLGDRLDGGGCAEAVPDGERREEAERELEGRRVRLVRPDRHGRAAEAHGRHRLGGGGQRDFQRDVEGRSLGHALTGADPQADAPGAHVDDAPEHVGPSPMRTEGSLAGDGVATVAATIGSGGRQHGVWRGGKHPVCPWGHARSDKDLHPFARGAASISLDALVEGPRRQRP